jgi:Mg-chelatase subunit ChlD
VLCVSSNVTHRRSRTLKILKTLALAAAFSTVANAQAKAALPVASQSEERPTIEAVFVLDTTGSMGGLLESAKQKVWSIASRMASGQPRPHIRVGLVAYRDVNDEYVTKHFDLTDDFDRVYSDLRGFVADGGGDTPEHVGRGIADAVQNMSWSQGSRVTKLMFVVGDAPSQSYNDGFDARTWTKNAMAKGIIVNTIRCGADASTENEFRALASLADGHYASINQNGGVLAVATPYDEELARVNAGLAGTLLVGGVKADQAKGRLAALEMKAAPAAVAADRAAFKSKAGAREGLGVSGVIDLASKPEALEAMKEEELPETVRAIAPAKRMAYVETTAADRKSYEEKLTTLAKKRDEWLRENTKAKKDSFDEQVFGSVRAAAAKVGVKY